MSGGGKLDGTVMEISDAEAPPVWRMMEMSALDWCRLQVSPQGILAPYDTIDFHRGGMNDVGVWVYRERR